MGAGRVGRRLANAAMYFLLLLGGYLRISASHSRKLFPALRFEFHYGIPRCSRGISTFLESSLCFSVVVTVSCRSWQDDEM